MPGLAVGLGGIFLGRIVLRLLRSAPAMQLNDVIPFRETDDLDGPAARCIAEFKITRVNLAP